MKAEKAIAPEKTPMLLERYYPGAMTFPVWVERKFNGFRCFIVVGDPMFRGNAAPLAFSREGRVLEAGLEAARELARRVGPGFYDGELVGASFRLTQSLIRRRSTEFLRFKCWDRLDVYQWATSGRTSEGLQRRRLGLLPLMPTPWLDTWRHCVDLVPGGWAYCEADLLAMYEHAIASGWEGLVVKDPRAGYQCGVRSRSWMKLKPKEGTVQK